VPPEPRAVQVPDAGNLAPKHSEQALGPDPVREPVGPQSPAAPVPAPETPEQTPEPADEKPESAEKAPPVPTPKPEIARELSRSDVADDPGASPVRLA
jgi:hypothetical protein